MELKSKPKTVGEKTVNLYEVGDGLWQLVIVDDDGTASGMSKPGNLTDTIAYVGDALHAPIVLHTFDDIEAERLASMKTVTGTVVSFDAHPTDQLIEGGYLEFKPETSEKIIPISVPSTETSTGLLISDRLKSSVGQTVTVTYEMIYTTGGDDPLRGLCDVVASA